MKTLTFALAMMAMFSLSVAISATLTGCPDQTIGERIDDALDNRPHEKLRDKAEDIGDAIKDATN